MSPYGDCEVVQSKVRSSSANSNVFMYACTYARTNVCLYVGERHKDRQTESQRARETELQREKTERQRDRVSKGRSVVSSYVFVCFCGVKGPKCHK